MTPLELEGLADGVRAADKAAVARALNLVEDRRQERQQEAARLLAMLTQEGEHGQGCRIGLTGPPGVGKSSLVRVLAAELRRRARSVGVLAVDPSSLRSGGALLGDRARMPFDPADRGLFVRSLATQGALGGLAHAAYGAIEVLGAAYEVVLVETVGVGQSEVAVSELVDAVVLVVQPGSGDVLQFLKAGVMEIPDLIVVNKSDHGALASRAASDLSAALAALERVHALAAPPPVLLASARDESGIETLLSALDKLPSAGDPAARQARRITGHTAWALEWLTRGVGSLGIAALGGQGALVAQLTLQLRAGEPALSAAQALAERLVLSCRPDPRASEG